MDLNDCEDHLFDELEGDEYKARKRLVELCYSITDQVDRDEIDGLPEAKEDEE